MRTKNPARALALAGAAAAGAVAGHTLTYLLAFPQAGTREAVLASTGHAYWFAAVSAALVFAALSASAAFVRGIRRGLRGPSLVAGAEPGIAAVVLRLFALQSAIYVLQEILERLDAGVPLSELVRGHILLIGIPLQFLVALAISVVLIALRKAGEHAGAVLRRPPLPRISRRAVRPPMQVAAPASVWFRLRGIRAPPAAA
ncbi:MAG TPA: hypothetical protein VGH10_07970 [Actinomycetota bacterium]|jgi:hypothetical protein